MKTIFTILIFLYSFSILCTQPAEIPVDVFLQKRGIELIQANKDFVVDSVVTYFDELSNTYKYTYNKDFQILTETCYRWTNDKVFMRYNATNTYDKVGNLTTRIIEIWYVYNDSTEKFRRAYTFDSNNNRIIYLYEEWIIDQWVKKKKETSEYDSNNKHISTLSEEWVDDEWKHFERETFIYDNKDSLITHLTEEWVDNEWKNYARISYEFDTDGNLLLELWEHWWGYNGWINHYRYTYSYDKNGNLLTDLYEYWYSGKMREKEEKIYTYSKQNLRLTRDYKMWYEGRLTDRQIHQYSYDANGYLIQYYFEDFSYWVNETHIDTNRVSYTHNNYGDILTILYEDLKDGNWVNWYRKTNTYNKNRELTIEFIEFWKLTYWEDYLKIYTDFDEHGNFIKKHSEGLDDDDWVKDAEIFNDFTFDDAHGNTFWTDAHITSVEVIWRRVSTDLNDKDDKELATTISPNPFTEFSVFNFQFPKSGHVTLIVYDALGVEVETVLNEYLEAGHNQATFDGSFLPAGMYYYVLQAGAKVQTGKMVLIK